MLKRKGERIPMAEAIATLNPAPRDPIEENRGLTGEILQLNPLTPEGREPFCLKNQVKSVPTNRIKGFVKV
jgi:hypothetical protein